MNRAKCAGMAPNRKTEPNRRDLFFPNKGESPNDGKKICFTCPVRIQCKEYRKRTGSDYGMWGGEIKGRDTDDS